MTKLELETIQQAIILETLYALGFGLIGLLINRVGKFPILCEFFLYFIIFHFNYFFKKQSNLNTNEYELYHSELVVLLVGTGITGYVCMLSDIPIVQVSAFIILMASGMAPNIVNASIVDLYPTSLR